jgi:hypothetical protein
MLNLAIENTVLENFYYQECNEDTKTFIEKMSHFVEINKVKNKINTAFNELELVKDGKLKTIPMDEILNELDD